MNYCRVFPHLYWSFESPCFLCQPAPVHQCYLQRWCGILLINSDAAIPANIISLASIFEGQERQFEAHLIAAGEGELGVGGTGGKPCCLLESMKIMKHWSVACCQYHLAASTKSGISYKSHHCWCEMGDLNQSMAMNECERESSLRTTNADEPWQPLRRIWWEIRHRSGRGTMLPRLWHWIVCLTAPTWGWTEDIQLCHKQKSAANLQFPLWWKSK